MNLKVKIEDVYDKGVIYSYVCPICGEKLLKVMNSGSSVNILSFSSCPHFRVEEFYDDVPKYASVVVGNHVIIPNIIGIAFSKAILKLFIL